VTPVVADHPVAETRAAVIDTPPPPPPPAPPTPVDEALLRDRFPTPSNAPAAPRPPRRVRKGWVIAAIAAALVLVAGVVGAMTLTGGSGDAASGWVSPCPAAPSVCITSVDAGDDGVTAQFTANDVQLVKDAVGDQLQAVFFLTNIDASGAGSVSNRSTTWAGWGPRAPFEGFAGETAGSNAVCVLVGNGAGQVAPNSGNCAELPAT
jgi:hypothetical protein